MDGFDAFEAPRPKKGDSLTVWARKGPGGEVIVDSIIRTRPTIKALLAALGRIRGVAWRCGCCATVGEDGVVTGYERCKAHPVL